MKAKLKEGDSLSDYSCIVLAAGDSTSFINPEGNGPKTLADLNGKPVIRHVVDNAIAAGIPAHKVTVVVKRALEDDFRKVFRGTDVRLAFQDAARGSAHAAQLVMEQGQLAPCKQVLILMGDQPLLQPATLSNMMVRQAQGKRLVTVATFRGNRMRSAFKKCGAILYESGRLTIARPAATVDQAIDLHAGPYAFLRSWLHECIMHIDFNRPGEVHVYLAVEAAATLGNGVLTFPIADAWEALGVDTYDALQAIRQGDRSYLNL